MAACLMATNCCSSLPFASLPDSQAISSRIYIHRLCVHVRHLRHSIFSLFLLSLMFHTDMSRYIISTTTVSFLAKFTSACSVACFHYRLFQLLPADTRTLEIPLSPVLQTVENSNDFGPLHSWPLLLFIRSLQRITFQITATECMSSCYHQSSTVSSLN